MLDIRKVPSAETLRQRFDAVRGAFDEEIEKFKKMINKVKKADFLPVKYGKGVTQGKGSCFADYPAVTECGIN